MGKMKRSEIIDITEWDSVNWGKALACIERLGLPIEGKNVLEIGSRNGGMSLFFAKRGATCLCTDLFVPGDAAKAKHKKWNVEDRIKYAALDATQIPDDFENSFDIITFKSVLGGVGSHKNIKKEKKMVEEIKKSLKDGGYVVFVENMKATKIHEVLRKSFRKYGDSWHYQDDNNITNLFSDYKLVSKKYFGFLGLFGPNETVRRVLGYIDNFFELFIPNRSRYIGVYIFKKSRFANGV